MKQLLSYVLFAGSFVIAYQGYVNSRLEPETEELARREATSLDSKCLVQGDEPREQRSSPLSRRYEWSTTIGPVLVECKREFVFFGAWACSAERGGFGAF